MAYSKQLGAKRVYKHEAVFKQVEELHAGTGIGFSYPTPEEAKMAREALYNYLKIRGSSIFYEINIINKRTFWVQDLREATAITRDGECYNLEKVIDYLKELTEDEYMVVIVALDRMDLVSKEDYSKIDEAIVKYQREQGKEASQQKLVAELGWDKPIVPLPEATPEELEEADRLNEETLAKIRQDKEEAINLAKASGEFAKFNPEPTEEVDSPEKQLKKTKQSIRQILAEQANNSPSHEKVEAQAALAHELDKARQLKEEEATALHGAVQTLGEVVLSDLFEEEEQP